MEKLIIAGLVGAVGGYMLCLARFKIKAAAEAKAKAALAAGSAAVQGAAAQVQKQL